MCIGRRFILPFQIATLNLSPGSLGHMVEEKTQKQLTPFITVEIGRNQDFVCFFEPSSYPLLINIVLPTHNMLLTTVTCQSLYEKLRVALPESKAVILQQHLILSKTGSVPQPEPLGFLFGGETPFPTNVLMCIWWRENREWIREAESDQDITSTKINLNITNGSSYLVTSLLTDCPSKFQV